MDQTMKYTPDFCDREYNARLAIPDQFAPSFLAEVEKAQPEYFSDLPPLPAAVN